MFAIILLVVLCLSSFAQTQPSIRQDAALESRIREIVREHHGDVTLFAENLTTHQTVMIAPDTVVHAASVIKLAVLYQALLQLRDGSVLLEDRITMHSLDQVPGSGVLHLLDAPLTLSFKDMLTLMIAFSDNTATNFAIDHLGLSNINRSIEDLGLSNTYLYKKVFTPISPGAAATGSTAVWSR